MRNVTPETLTQTFVEYAAKAGDQRTKDVLCALARHLHAFVKETRLTHAEWMAGLMALTRAGEITTPERNEFILFSDLFGVSSLVDMVNTPVGATSCSNLGPFHQHGAPPLADGGDMWKGQPGEPLVVLGRIVDGATGQGVRGATLDMWQNADNGFYAAQDTDQPAKNYHGMLTCAVDGSFCFTTTRPKPYTVPYDGPAGGMLTALARDAWRPAHLHLIAEAPGYVPLVTELFPEGDVYLDSDAVFGVRADIVVPLAESGDKAALPAHLAMKDALPAQFLVTEFVVRMARKA